MGREIRRVPLGFAHEQPMLDKTFAEAQAEYEQERQEAIEKGAADQVWGDDDLAFYRERLIRSLSGNDVFARVSRKQDLEQFEYAEAHYGEKKYASLDEYVGEPPKQGDAVYRPEWPAETELGYAVYETVSEGMAITPTYATKEALVEHLVTFGTEWDERMTREAAERFVESAWAPSMVVLSAPGEPVVVESGLESYEPGGSLAKPRGPRDPEDVIAERAAELIGGGMAQGNSWRQAHAEERERHREAEAEAYDEDARRRHEAAAGLDAAYKGGGADRGEG
jgi:hypothetical protein